MSPVSISESRPFTIASGEPRHRMNTNAVKLASGDILVFYRDGSDHWRTFDSAVMMVRSKDEGETWSAPEHVFSEPGYGSSAHHGAEQLSDGRLILPVTLIGEILRSPMGETNVKDSRKAKVYVLTSEDDGNSWSEPVQVGPMEGWYWQNQYGRVRELPDGRVFVPGGGQKNGEEAWYSGYFVSHDGGRTFPDRIEIAHGLADELDLALLPDGRWIAMVRDLPRASISRLSPEEREQTFFYLHQSYSKDEGSTWSEPVSSGVLGHCPSFLVLPSGTILLGHR